MEIPPVACLAAVKTGVDEEIWNVTPLLSHTDMHCILQIINQEIELDLVRKYNLISDMRVRKDWLLE